MSACPKPFKVRSKHLRNSAKGETCTLRLPGICTHDPTTTVLCHLPGHAKGVATKENDLHAAYGCDRCHAVIDGTTNYRAGLSEGYVLDAMLRALSETQVRMIEKGLIQVKGWARE